MLNESEIIANSVDADIRCQQLSQYGNTNNVRGEKVSWIFILLVMFRFMNLSYYWLRHKTVETLDG